MKGRIDDNQCVLSAILNHLEQTDVIPSLSTALHIEMNHIPFHLHAEDGRVILLFDNWRSAFTFLNSLRNVILVREETLGKLKNVLQKIDLTIYLQNEKIAVIGPRAGSVMPRILTLASLFLKK